MSGPLDPRLKWSADGELYLSVDFRLARVETPEGWHVSTLSMSVDPPQPIDIDALGLVRSVLGARKPEPSEESA